jgi:hypothetical protein
VSTFLLSLLVGLLGGMAGFAVLALLERGAEPRASTRLQEEGNEAKFVDFQNEVGPVRASDVPHSDLERRVRTLESERQDERQRRLREETVNIERPQAETWETFREEHHRQHLAHHSKEPRDAAWADRTEQEIGTKLALLSERSDYDVLRLECRSRTCSCELGWPDYPTAVSTYARVLQQLNIAGCGQEILLSPPPDPLQSYQATMLFACRSSD